MARLILYKKTDFAMIATENAQDTPCNFATY